MDESGEAIKDVEAPVTILAEEARIDDRWGQNDEKAKQEDVSCSESVFFGEKSK